MTSAEWYYLISSILLVLIMRVVITCSATLLRIERALGERAAGKDR
jgi:hypothetical protein